MANKKRTRATHPKVRTGCHTCKARRVKCDEQRPACQKCLSTGRTCNGYENNREWIVVVAPPPPVPDGFEDDRDRRSFDYFRSLNVHELSWFFEGSFWGKIVLQASHSSAAIRHAVIALACTHEDFRLNTLFDLIAPQYAYASQHYSKAIRHLLKETVGDSVEERVRALICGLLFISIEALRGNTQLALHHLEGCLKIVREEQGRMLAKDKITGDHFSDPRSVLIEEIVPMFARLDVQTSLVLGRKPPNVLLDRTPLVWQPSEHVLLQDEIPAIFACTADASNAILVIANQVHNFMSWYSDRYRHCNIEELPFEVLAESQSLQNQLHAWEEAVTTLINSCEDKAEWKQLLVLRIRYHMGSTLLASALHAEESALDAYATHFQSIVDLSTELEAHRQRSAEILRYDSITAYARRFRSNPEPSSLCSSADPSSGCPEGKETPPPNWIPPSFMLDQGIVFPLYWTALKCRDGFLRRRAIYILSTTATESVWCGSIQAQIAKRIIEIEENQKYEQFPSPENMKVAESILECMRIHSVTTDYYRTKRQAKILISRRLNGPNGNWDGQIEWVSW